MGGATPAFCRVFNFVFFFVVLAAVGCVLLIEVNDHTLKDRNVEGTGAGEPHPNPRGS